MGFFSDLREDLSQAINELLPGGSEEPIRDIAAPKVFVEQENESSIPVYEEPVEETVTEEAEQAAMDETAESVVYEEPEENWMWKPETQEETDLMDNADVAETYEEETQEAVNEDYEEALPETEPETVYESEIAVEEEQPLTQEDNLREPAITIVEPSEQAEITQETEMQSPVEENEEQEELPEIEKSVYEGTGMHSALGQSMTLVGKVEGTGSFDVFGYMEGDISITGALGCYGTVYGDIKAGKVMTHGAKINGDITCEGHVLIGSDSVVIGNITASGATIIGAVKGDVDVNGPVELAETAVVMGNIKSKTVQIDNGAVIEGMCSRCYAQVDTQALFE